MGRVFYIKNFGVNCFCVYLQRKQKNTFMETKQIWKKGDEFSLTEFVENRGTHARDWKTIDGKIVTDTLTIIDESPENVLTIKIVQDLPTEKKSETIKIWFWHLPHLIQLWNNYFTPSKNFALCLR